MKNKNKFLKCLSALAIIGATSIAASCGGNKKSVESTTSSVVSPSTTTTTTTTSVLTSSASTSLVQTTTTATATAVTTTVSTSNVNNSESKIKELEKKYNAISIAKAIELATNAGSNPTSEEYVCVGKIVNVSNPTYGEMTITDGTNSIYVYGVNSSNGTKYSELEAKPVAGDIIVIKGTLKTFKDTPEFGKSAFLEYVHEDAKANDEYNKCAIKEAREASVGDKVSVTGVVAKLTYANGMNPNGFLLIDNTGSIYIYDSNVAIQVKEGNTINIEGTREQFISSKEQANASKYGYTGCIQLTDCNLITNDNKVSSFSTDGIKESTVKEIMDTKMSTNITSNVYKVNALITKVAEAGFTNYYFTDVDGITGSYVYTACNGSDFAWLDEFDSKICEVYLCPLNCKSSDQGCVYRFIPVAVTDKNYQFDMSTICEFTFKYFLENQFVDNYEADPELVMYSNVDIYPINVNGVNVSYTSSNTNVCYFETTQDSVIMHTKDNGSAQITMNITYDTYSLAKNVTINVNNTTDDAQGMTVKQALDAVEESSVTIKGVVGPSLVNQMGFYLIDDTGVIAVKVSAETMATLKIGDLVSLTGTRQMYSKKANSVGQSVIVDAVINTNLHGNNEYSTATFINDKTLADVVSLSVSEDHTYEVYTLTATITVVKTDKYTNLKVSSNGSELGLYCASASQYSFLEQFDGKEVILQVAPCNWNDKSSYKGCVLAVTYNGNTVYNELNFN